MSVPDDDDNASPLLELIPPSELEPQQIVERRNSAAVPSTVPIYKFVRAPVTFHELNPCRRVDTMVGMENATLVFLNCPYRPSEIAVEYSKRMEMVFFFGSNFVRLTIFGESKDAILETAVFFASLKLPEERKIMIKKRFWFQNNVHFQASHAEQLALLFDANPAIKTKIHLSTLDNVFSAVIASRPYPIHLELESCRVNMGAFVEHLEFRAISFGSLTMDHGTVARATGDISRLFNHLHLFDHLELTGLPRDLYLKLLSGPTKSIAIHVDREEDDIEWQAVDIVPKRIVVKDIGNAQFFHRIAELGHLESLKLTCETNNDYPAPMDVRKALISAVGANKNLTILELSQNRRIWDNCLQDLFSVLEKHEGLRSLFIDYYPIVLDPYFSWLKQLLKRNRLFEIITIRDHHLKDDRYACHWQMDFEMERICSVNRFHRGSPLLLTHELPSTRLLLICAALTHDGTRDFQPTALLLADHLDLLCEVLYDRMERDE